MLCGPSRLAGGAEDAEDNACGATVTGCSARRALDIVLAERRVSNPRRHRLILRLEGRHYPDVGHAPAARQGF